MSSCVKEAKLSDTAIVGQDRTEHGALFTGAGWNSARHGTKLGAKVTQVFCEAPEQPKGKLFLW